MLDFLNNDAFSETTLTEAINSIDPVPGRAGELVFEGIGRGIATTTATFESQDGSLSLIKTSKRGENGQQNTTGDRKIAALPVPHVQLDDTVRADEIQNVRAFGRTDTLAGPQAVINQRLAEMALKHDLTAENLRMGALSGSIKDADGTELANLFSVFGVTQEAEFDLNLDSATTDVRTICAQIVRKMKANLRTAVGTSFRPWAFVGDNLFDALINHPSVKGAYDGYAAAERRLGESYAHGVFEFGGIFWENYAGSAGVGVDADKAVLFPTGVPGVYAEYYAPADTIAAANSIGLPRYARTYATPNGKAVVLETQQNPLPVCLRPKALLRARRT